MYPPSRGFFSQTDRERWHRQVDTHARNGLELCERWRGSARELTRGERMADDKEIRHRALLGGRVLLYTAPTLAARGVTRRRDSISEASQKVASNDKALRGQVIAITLMRKIGRGQCIQGQC